jgi:rare lipoprotein A (peptidoglycan hydrolase)
LIRYANVDVRTKEVECPIPFTTLTTFTTELEPGVVRILRPGVAGLMLRTVRARVVDGEVVARRVVDQRVLSPAVSQGRLVGRRNSTSGTQVGEASWYYAPGSGFTAAHPSLPFGTAVTVTNLVNGRSVTVVINDRGPFGGRIIDLSPEAFSAIAPLGQGVAQVRLTW